MVLDADMEFRLAVFEHVGRLRSDHGGLIPSSALDAGVLVGGQRFPLWNLRRGIYRPAHLRFPGAALTAVTSPNSPYDDQVDRESGHLVYKYQGKNPDHADNAALRRAFELQRPLLYLYGISKGLYDASFPCYVSEDDPDALSFHLIVDAQVELGLVAGADPMQFEARRAYRTVATQMRLHQQKFRFLVLGAYRKQCAMCRLRHLPLLDAAHIIPDGDPRGRAILPNGLSLCKIHHSAYDVGILGVDPDCRIHLRQDVLEEHDGPMLRHGLQEMHGGHIQVPHAPANRPDRDFLAERFERFLAA